MSTNPSPLRGIAVIGSAYFDKSRLAEIEFRPLSEVRAQFAALTSTTSTPAQKAALRAEFEPLLQNAARAVPPGKRAAFLKGARGIFEQDANAALNLVRSMPTNKL